MVEDEVEAGNAAASCLTDAGGVGEVMGQPAAENVVLGCRYGELCMFFACQSNGSVNQPAPLREQDYRRWWTIRHTTVRALINTCIKHKLYYSALINTI